MANLSYFLQLAVIGVLMTTTLGQQGGALGQGLTQILSLVSGSGRAASDGSAYSGSRVGPLWLFRSSADNAEIVNEGFKNNPIARSLALAYGDEFPKLRDDLIERTRSGSDSILQRHLSAFTNLQNWRYERENNKKEIEGPYKRNGGGGGGGPLSSVLAAFSSLRGPTSTSRPRISIA